MPSHPHETLAEMFRHRPELAAEVLTDVLGVPLPAYSDVRLAAAEATALRPTEHRADAVLLLSEAGRTVAAVIVEIQLDVRPEKHRTWPHYLTSIGLRWRCPALLLVVCVDQATARWAATPIETGHPGFALRPIVLGPALVPVVSDPVAAARSPELTVLSALAHVGDDPPTVVDLLPAALASIDPDLAVNYAFLVLDAAPERVRARLEDLMAETAPYVYDNVFTRRAHAEGELRGRAEGEIRGRAEGEIRGRAEGEIRGRVAILLRVLDRRGVEVPESARVRISTCTDLDQLETWSDRAVDAVTVDDLFL